jgi:hypothetical protein
MRGILAGAAVLAMAGLGLAATSALAAEVCKADSCATASAEPTANGWTVNFTIRNPPGSDYEFFNLRVSGHDQMELDAPGNHVTLSLPLPAGWDGAYAVQACRNNPPLGARCDAFNFFQAEFLLAVGDRDFCIAYAGHATAAGTAAQQQNCGFETASGRWSTDNSAHLNWCRYQFQLAGGVANKLVAARNLVNAEEANRTGGLDACQSNATAQARFEADRADEMRVTGKSTAECQASNATCEARFQHLGGLDGGKSVIAAQCTPFLQQCMANAAAAEQAFAEQRADEMQVTGKSIAECQASNATCEARFQNLGGLDGGKGVIAAQCTPYLQQCMNNATAALAAAAQAPGDQPPVQGGGPLTASTCGLPGGIATVVIPDPAITELNVRDAPNGNLLTRIAEGTPVQVAGGCGVQLSAGIVSGASNAAPPVPGWCAITSPTIGCVSEQFLVAGNAGGGAANFGGAGIVSTQPQTAPQPPQQPQTNQPPAAQVVVVPGAGQTGGTLARLTQGANIRNAASGGDGAKTGKSLPGGTVVTVLECVPSWCRLALPQFPVAWVSRSFLAFDVAPAPSVDVTINIGNGAQQPALPQPPAPGGGTTSACALPGGTATVVIPDPNVNELNVRDRPMGNIVSKIPKGTQVNVVGGCGVQIAAGIVAPAPGGGGQPTPGWCAISAPVIGCVSQQFLVAGIVAGGAVQLPPAAGIVAPEPQQQAAATFTGRWNAEAQGSAYTFNLTQTGDNVSGAYVGGDGPNGSQGQITGTLTGNVLRFQWWQTDGVRGMGKFTLSADGSAFTGSYTLGSNPDVAEGSWNGRRM